MGAGTSLLFLSRVVAVAITLSIAVLSYRAYCRTRERTFKFSLVGFVLISVGLAIKLYTVSTGPFRVTEIHVLQSSVLAAGFVILYLSITGWRVSSGR